MRPQAQRSDRRTTPARWDGAAPSLPARSPRAYVRIGSGRGGTRPEPSTWPCRHPRELEAMLWAGDADPRDLPTRTACCQGPGRRSHRDGRLFAAPPNAGVEVVPRDEVRESSGHESTGFRRSDSICGDGPLGPGSDRRKRCTGRLLLGRNLLILPICIEFANGSDDQLWFFLTKCLNSRPSAR